MDENCPFVTLATNQISFNPRVADGFSAQKTKKFVELNEKFHLNFSCKCLSFDVASRSTRRDRRRERCFVLPAEIHRMGSGRIHFDNSSMETDCEHQRLLVDLGEQLPDLNEDIQAFLSIVSRKILSRIEGNSLVFDFSRIGEMDAW